VKLQERGIGEFTVEADQAVKRSGDAASRGRGKAADGFEDG
jgi:hypothetical protein